MSTRVKMNAIWRRSRKTRRATRFSWPRLPDGELVGFVEAALRKWAEGCSTSPVGYIEGWYVQPEHRRAGVGGRLIEAAEDWARARGCTEMGSDAELWNEVSHAAHRALGYTEATRLLCFSKPIGEGDSKS